MQKAFFIRGRPPVSAYAGFDIIYIGDEFCGLCLPEKKDIDELIRHDGIDKKKIVIVTPVLTSRDPESILKILDFVCEKVDSPAVVINDWIMLDILKRFRGMIEPIAGRILVSRYLNKFHTHGYDRFSNNENEKEFYCLFPDKFIEFIKSNGIYRLEFNDFDHLRLTSGQLKGNNIASHIYYPFAYINTSRYCTAAGGYGSYKEDPAEDCKKECINSFSTMNNKYLRSQVYIKGNAYHIKTVLGEGCFEGVADRVIYNNFSS